MVDLPTKCLAKVQMMGYVHLAFLKTLVTDHVYTIFHAWEIENIYKERNRR